MTDRDDVPFYERAIDEGADLGAIGNRRLAADDPARLLDLTWTPDPQPDRDRNQLVVPRFDDQPCPAATRFLFVASRSARVAPPWRVRVSARLCATYTMTVVARALAPHAQIITTPDGRHPAPMYHPDLDIECDDRDQLLPAVAGSRDPASLWTPDTAQRTR